MPTVDAGAGLALAMPPSAIVASRSRRERFWICILPPAGSFYRILFAGPRGPRQSVSIATPLYGVGKGRRGQSDEPDPGGEGHEPGVRPPVAIEPLLELGQLRLGENRAIGSLEHARREL